MPSNLLSTFVTSENSASHDLPFDSAGYNNSSPYWPLGGVPGFNVVVTFTIFDEEPDAPMLQLVPNPYSDACAELARAEMRKREENIMELGKFASLCLF